MFSLLKSQILRASNDKMPTSGADCIMLGFTRSLLLDLAPCLSENFGEPDTDSLLMVLRVSSNLQMVTDILNREDGWHGYAT